MFRKMMKHAISSFVHVSMAILGNTAQQLLGPTKPWKDSARLSKDRKSLSENWGYAHANFPELLFIPSGKLTYITLYNYGKSSFFMGKSTNYMAIFNRNCMFTRGSIFLSRKINYELAGSTNQLVVTAMCDLY